MSEAAANRRGRRRRRATRRRLPIVVGSVALVVAAAVVAVWLTVGLPPWSDESAARGVPTPPSPATPTWQPAGSVLDGAPAPSIGSAGKSFGAVLDPALASGDLGGSVGASVIDVASGEVVYSANSSTPQTPASTLKLLTTTAALARLGPGHTFETRVVSGDDGQITLVGGGDPLLLNGDDGTDLEQLAKQTAAELAKQDVSSVRLTYDDSLFSGPEIDPDWEPDYVSSGVASRVSALTVYGGRTGQDDIARSENPAGEAAEMFAGMLAEHGIEVEGSPSPALAPADAEELAGINSVPLSVIVEHIIATSDNDAAEVLARHVAVAAGQPGSGENAEAAVVGALTELGVEMGGARVLDGSGLARGSAVPAAALTAVLGLTASDDHPELRSVITGLAVAGFSGTLDDRFLADDSAVGSVRGKTGTLTGVNSLAGLVVAADGGTYAFAFMADDTTDALAAEAALDAAASALATCGCR